MNSEAAPTRRLGLWQFAALVFVILVAAEAVWLAIIVIPSNPTVWSIGQDYRFYRDLGVQFLAGDGFYRPTQLSGPYVNYLMHDNLYPPSALFLFVPFTVLPAVLWWVIPIALTGYVLAKLRPAPWTWVAMLLLLAWPGAIGSYLFGNTNIWAVAAVAAGIRWGWPASLLLLKPVFAPFALVGIRHRSWWIVTALVAAVSLAMLPLWFDYLTAMRNLSINADYSLGTVPLMVIPLVAWVGRHQAHSPEADLQDSFPGQGQPNAEPAAPAAVSAATARALAAPGWPLGEEARSVESRR